MPEPTFEPARDAYDNQQEIPRCPSPEKTA